MSNRGIDCLRAKERKTMAQPEKPAGRRGDPARGAQAGTQAPARGAIAPDVAALRSGRCAGVAVRRTPPPERSSADTPWRVVPAGSYDGNSTRQVAGFAPRPPTAPSGLPPRSSGAGRSEVRHRPDDGGLPKTTPYNLTPRSAERGTRGTPEDAASDFVTTRNSAPRESGSFAPPEAGFDCDYAPGDDGRGKKPSNLYHGIVKLQCATSKNDQSEWKGPDADRTASLVKAHEERKHKRPPSTGTPPDILSCLRRAKILFARYRREIGLPIPEEDSDGKTFVEWLFSLRPMVSSSSWGVYRSSVLTWLASYPHTNREAAIDLLAADVGAGADAYQGRRQGRPPGRAQFEMARRFGNVDFYRVLSDSVRHSRSDAVPWLQDWMIAGISAGLRPSEWALTDLEVRKDDSRASGRQARLYVMRPSATDVGQTIIQRTLDISDFSEAAFQAVRNMVERGQEWTSTQRYDRRQSQCGQLLYQVCEMLFPRQRQRYSLDSVHHQFIANMKCLYEPAAVAALVGHIVVDGPVEHYGKRRAAWRRDEIRDVPVPIPEQVRGMARQLQFYEERHEAQELRRAAKRRREEAKSKRAKSKG